MAGKGKTHPLDAVRALFHKSGLDAVWKWAVDGEGAQEKAHRFRIATVFARIERDKNDPTDKIDWGKVRSTYAEQRDKWEAKAKENADNAFNDSAGAPHWGGSRDFFDEFIYPIAKQFGMEADYDDKEFGHAVGGDHDPNVLNAFAEDFPTFSGAAFAAAVAAKFGHPGGWTGTYAFINVPWKGKTFRVQILWGVPDHFNHVHIGARTI